MTETIEQRFARLAPAAHALVEIARGEALLQTGEHVDTADVSPCPGCGKPVRRFSSTRWDRGTRESYQPWWCAECIQTKCEAAAEGVRPVVDRPPL